MSRLKISVCISTYNHCRYIEHCILSVISQNVSAEVEILVGNDGSTDGTTEIIEELTRQYDGRIIHIHRRENIGPFENLKLLILKAQGDFIAHLDGDDYWQPGKLRAQMSFLVNNPGCVACYTNAWVVRDDLTPMGIFNNTIPVRFDLRFLLCKGNFLNHSSIFYRAVYKVNILNFPTNFIDYRIHIELAMHGALGYINAPYVVYRYASSQSMIRLANEQVRDLYLEAVLYGLSNDSIDDVYDVTLEDFVARIVRDGLAAANPKFLFRWFRVLSQNIKKERARILLFGSIGGLLKLFAAILRRILTILRLTNELRVINER